MFNQILDKLQIILILSLTINYLEKSGFIEKLIYPLNRIHNIKNVITFWFIIGMLVSSIFIDLTAAAILCPMVIIYIDLNNITKNKELVLLSMILGICVGGDLTKYGGGDNLVLTGLFEDAFGFELTNAIWSIYLIPPTLCLAIITILILRQFTQDEIVSMKVYNQYPFKLIPTISSMIIIISIFQGNLLISWIFLFITGCLLKINKDIFKSIPYKAMGVWTIAFIIGKIFGQIVQTHIDLSFATNNSNSTLILLVIISTVLTTFCTQTAITSCIYGIVFSIYGPNYAVIMLMIKSINSAYLTILNNGCLVLGNGYGITQKSLFKIGSLLLIPQIFIEIIWYLIIR